MDWIDQVRQRLAGALPEGSRVILFGSHARGQARPHSDLDLLVVEPEVIDHHAEMARLAALLGRARIPADVVVMSAAAFDRQSGVVNTLAWRAQREGRVL